MFLKRSNSVPLDPRRALQNKKQIPLGVTENNRIK